MNKTISRLSKILAAFIRATLLGECCTKREADTLTHRKA